MKTCRAPDCGKALSRKNTSGVCAFHSHSKWCRCTYCDIPEPEPRVIPDGWKVVRRMVAGISTRDPVYAEITLPRAPWERQV